MKDPLNLSRARGAQAHLLIKLCIGLLFAALATGCASMQAADLSPYLPFGIVSIVSNNDIYWYGEGQLGTAPSDDLAKTKYSKADQLINDADDILWNLFLRGFITTYDGEAQITGSDAYADAEIDRRLDNNKHVIASGYRYINFRDKAFAANLARERGVKGSVYISFDFAKQMASGIGKTGSCRALVETQVLIVNEAGKVVYRKTRFRTSEDKIPVSFGSYNHEELMGLFRTVIEDLYLEFLAEFDPNNKLFRPQEPGIMPDVPQGGIF
jgi:hypothetical protein